MSSGQATINIPLVDLRRQYRDIQSEIDGAIKRVVESGRFILGPEVETFEREFAEYVGTPTAVGVASGTAALHLALIACGVGTGDEVITSPHTFIATAEAISHTGARPVFVDIDPETYTLDPQRVAEAITERTKAIVPVHLYGHPAEMQPLLALSERHGIWLVEDAAQAHGAEYSGQRCGAIGHLAAFSFFPGKNLGAYGDAGAVTGRSPDLLERVRRLRDHGRRTKYLHDEIGYGERLDSLQAAILSVKLAHLERWTESRRRIAARYSETLAPTILKAPFERLGARHVYHLYVIRAPDRDRLQHSLAQVGISAGIHYPVPMHRQPAYAEFRSMTFREAELAAAEVLSLPIYPEMNDREVDYVIDHVLRYAVQ